MDEIEPQHPVDGTANYDALTRQQFESLEEQYIAEGAANMK